jgi:prolyl-tRNA synthetase
MLLHRALTLLTIGRCRHLVIRDLESRPYLGLQSRVHTMSLSTVLESLNSLSLTPPSVTHIPSPTPTLWRSTLLSTPSVPQQFTLLRSLIFKPKTAKTAVPVPIVVIVRDGVEIAVGPLGKKLGVKEMRLVGQEMVTEILGVDKDSGPYPFLPSSSMC